jgi:multidrug efflux system membrane fusion protein
MFRTLKFTARIASAATLSLALSLLISACGRNEAATAQAQMPAPQVSVAEVVAKPITEFDEFTGRIQAVERVEIRPRVSGYIASVNFKEGHEVHQGEVLFVIDPRPYAAELKRAQAQLTHAISERTLAKTEHDRATKLLNLHAISQEEFDTRAAGNGQAEADVQGAQAAVDAAQLNLTFTEVRAPISGLIGRAEITAGNLVSSGDTLLTTLVSIDPVYVEFQGDERVYLKYAALARQSKGDKGVTDLRDGSDPLWIGLADESGYPHEGKIVFLDNTLNAATGTIRVRGRLDNRERRFTPGMFARVKLTGGSKYNALLIKDSAVGTDQSVKYVFVVNADNKIEYRPLKLGPLVDGLRVVREGLQPGESIVVNGLQRVRPGAVVNPQRVAMEQPVDKGNASEGPLLARTGDKKSAQL